MSDNDRTHKKPDFKDLFMLAVAAISAGSLFWITMTAQVDLDVADAYRCGQAEQMIKAADRAFGIAPRDAIPEMCRAYRSIANSTPAKGRNK